VKEVEEEEEHGDNKFTREKKKTEASPKECLYNHTK
jgi:hypothetical protein